MNSLHPLRHLEFRPYHCAPECQLLDRLFGNKATRPSSQAVEPRVVVVRKAAYGEVLDPVQIAKTVGVAQ